MLASFLDWIQRIGPWGAVVFGAAYVPAALLGHGPIGIYRGALATNAVLAGLLVLAAWWVAGQFEPLRAPRLRFAAACAVGLYTSFLGYTGLAAPEIAFAALELALVGIVACALRGGRAHWWALAGTGCAAAWLLHPRGAGVGAQRRERGEYLAE